MVRDFLALTPAGGGDVYNDFVSHNSSHNSGIACLLETSAKDTISSTGSAMPFVLPPATGAQ
jgi:hypothetical protein